MSFSVFSFLMSVLFSIVFILAVHALRNRPFFIKSFGVHTLLIMYGLCLFRMVFVIELPFTVPLGLKGIFSRAYDRARGFQLPVGSGDVGVPEVLISVWALVTVVLSVRLVWQEYICRKRLSSSHKNRNYPAERVLAKVRKKSTSSVFVRVCVCPYIDTPFGMGLIQKWIYLPDEEYTQEELCCIMKHEYTHFCNRDGVVKLLTLIFCCVFWWNPAVYLLKKDVEQILEIKCDVSSTRNFDKKERLEYLLTIVKVLKGGSQSKSVSSPLITTRSVSRTKHDDIKERFELITKATKQFGMGNNASEISRTSDNVKTQYAELAGCGYFSPPRVEKVEHPATYHLKHYLARNIEKVTLQITQNCNLRCKYCIYSEDSNLSQRSHSSNKMTFDIAKKH